MSEDGKINRFCHKHKKPDVIVTKTKHCEVTLPRETAANSLLCYDHILPVYRWRTHPTASARGRVSFVSHVMTRFILLVVTHWHNRTLSLHTLYFLNHVTMR